MPPKQKERPTVGEKRWRSGEEPPSENRQAAESSGLMATSWSAAREEEGRQRRPIETDHPSGQRGASIGVEADLASTIEQLQSHLRSMMTLLARTVTPSVEGRMTEKRGKATLEQATSMMVAVGHSLLKESLPTFLGVISSLIAFSLFIAGAMAMAWAHQDCSKPLDQAEQQAEKMKELRALVIDLENKLGAKEEELKSNEIKLVARTEKYGRFKLRLGC